LSTSWSKSRISAAVAVILALLAGACGFQPLHGPRGDRGGSVLSDLAYVRIAEADDRNSQIVRNRLIELFGVAGLRVSPVYELRIKIDESREGVGFQRDDTVTRFNLRLAADFILIDQRAGIKVMDGRTRSIAAYNVVRSDYANLIAQRDARRRAALAIAEDIRDQTAVFFARMRQPDAAAGK
jgi:LPS-assembly lipoprotein